MSLIVFVASTHGVALAGETLKVRANGSPDVHQKVFKDSSSDFVLGFVGYAWLNLFTFPEVWKEFKDGEQSPHRLGKILGEHKSRDIDRKCWSELFTEYVGAFREGRGYRMFRCFDDEVIDLGSTADRGLKDPPLIQVIGQTGPLRGVLRGYDSAQRKSSTINTAVERPFPGLASPPRRHWTKVADSFSFGREGRIDDVSSLEIIATRLVEAACTQANFARTVDPSLKLILQMPVITVSPSPILESRHDYQNDKQLVSPWNINHEVARSVIALRDVLLDLNATVGTVPSFKCQYSQTLQDLRRIQTPSSFSSVACDRFQQLQTRLEQLKVHGIDADAKLEAAISHAYFWLTNHLSPELLEQKKAELHERGVAETESNHEAFVRNYVMEAVTYDAPKSRSVLPLSITHPGQGTVIIRGFVDLIGVRLQSPYKYVMQEAERQILELGNGSLTLD